MALLTQRRSGARVVARWLFVLLFGGAGIGMMAAPPSAAAPASIAAEYQLKAVFLFNFAQFVEWPPEVFATPDSPLVIGILGSDPFGAYLDDLVRDERIGNRPLAVRRFAKEEEITACHILFVAPPLEGQLAGITPKLQSRHLLTVGEAENFNRLGGIVRFVTEKGRIRLRVNMDSARKSGLTLSSKLLRWATIVDSGERP